MKSHYKTLFALFASALFFFSCSDSEQMPKREKKIVPIKSVNDVLANLSKLPQNFEIDPKVENVLKGAQGTVIYIPADAFQLEDGSAPTGKVSIELRECYAISDIIAENLHTQSSDQLLETGGMIYVNATADGKVLTLKKDKAYIAAFPKAKDAKEMELFYNFQRSDTTTTWLTTTDMEASRPAEENPLLGEDVRDYYFWYGKYNVALGKYKLKGQNRSLLEYLNDTTVVPKSVVVEFEKNEWRVYLTMRIDRNGKLHDFKRDPEEQDHSSGTDYAYKTMIGILEKAPPLEINGEDPILGYDWDYNLGMTADSKLNQERLKAKLKARYQQYENQAVAKIDEAELNYYVFAVTRMGWINCDRFQNTDEKKIDFKVQVPNSKEVKVQIVFKDMKSIMCGSLEGEYLVFKNVPLDRKIRIIAISYKEGKPTLATLESTITDKPVALNNFKEFTLNELEAELNK